MTNQQHPMKPSPELVRMLLNLPGEERIAAAYRAGADQELEACCAAEHTVYGEQKANWLRSLRRPKPPSLAERAMEAHESCTFDKPGDRATIRAALERLQQLEQESNR